MPPATLSAKKRRQSGLLALAGETAKMAQNMMVLDKTEAALERELEKEENRKPTTELAKIRYKGELILHSKYVLLAIVILNVVDCLLVLGELMLDIKYVTDLLTEEYDRSADFIDSMKSMYPGQLAYLDKSDIEILEKELLNAKITWDNSLHSVLEPHRRKRADDQIPGPGLHINESTNGTAHATGHHGTHHEHSLEEKIAHGLHKASIGILGILVIETCFKVFCLGREMLERKLECFDGIIVVASFIVDLVFLKGLQQFAVQEFVLILAFMVPWRIIRVVNSLVVAIMDHEHFRLKLLYKQKKKISADLKEAKDDIKGLQACIDALERLAEAAGVPQMHVKSKLNLYKRVKSKNNAMGALGSFAVGGEAMTKPMPATNQPPSFSLLSETKEKSASAKRFEELLKENPGSTVTELVANIVAERHSASRETRPRSRSAIDPVTRLETLAENSAAFIVTMNKDDQLGRYRDGVRRSCSRLGESKQPENLKEEGEGSNSSTKGLMQSNEDERKTGNESKTLND